MRADRGVFRRASIAVVVGLTLTSCAIEDELLADSDAAAATTSINTPMQTKPTRTKSATPTPTVTTKTVTKTKTIPFDTVEREDPDLEVGTSELIRAGEAGTRTFTYEVTLTDGVESSRFLVNKEVTKKPVDKVIAVGTYEPPLEPEPGPQGDCDSNYSGCVPIDSDVDCAGGSGNGPSYASGPVSVISADIYGLDADGDGVACE